MTKRVYQKVLPLDDNSKVIDQFGWLPVSIFCPLKKPHLEMFIDDKGDPAGTRRSKDAKYLPSLRYSRFHPHLAEAIISYWSLPDDLIIDPFAGRSTRAVIAGYLSRRYIGYEIIPEVARATQDNVDKHNFESVSIYQSDGCLLADIADETADLVFTCPPYHRLERYEEAPGQLSDIKEYSDFLEAIRLVADNITRVLAPGKFLCWVCADWRDGKAFRIFHKDSLEIFEAAGLIPWDIMIIQNNSPFAALQAGKVAAKRYTSKIHEYLLVFRKPIGAENWEKKQKRANF